MSDQAKAWWESIEAREISDETKNLVPQFKRGYYLGSPVFSSDLSPDQMTVEILIPQRIAIDLVVMDFKDRGIIPRNEILEGFPAHFPRYPQANFVEFYVRNSPKLRSFLASLDQKRNSL